MEPVSARELEAVLEHLRTIDNPVKSPVAKVSVFLLNNFGWPRGQARKRSILIIERLTKAKHIETIHNKKGSIHAVNAVTGRTPEDDSPRLLKPAEPKVRNIEPLPRVIRRDVPKLKKGEAQRRKAAYEKGDRNEQRLHRLVSRLLEMLKEALPEKITEVSCFCSGKNNKRKGKIDLQDKAGEDVVPLLTVRSDHGGFENKRVIYDAKSSEKFAEKFNRHIVYRPGQEGASLKKAIVVNDRRSDREIAAEVLGDFAKAGIIPPDITETVADRFSELAA